MTVPDPRVFISYSRNDRLLVKPLVDLLRLRGDHVFFDLDSLTPGQLWRDELEKALETAAWFVLFWCDHASRSREVEREFRAALALGKRIVPLLLDDTPLPERVAAFQGIDFRAVSGLHACAPSSAPVRDSHPYTTTDPFAAFAPEASALHAVFGEAGGTIGRAPDATISLPDETRVISRRHLQVLHELGQFRVVNRGTSAVLLDGQPLEPGDSRPWRDGQSLRLWTYDLIAHEQKGAVRALRVEASPVPPSERVSLKRELRTTVASPPALPRRIPDDFDPFAPASAPAPTAAAGYEPGPSLSIDALFGLIPSPPPPDALSQAADRLLARLRSGD